MYTPHRHASVRPASQTRRAGQAISQAQKEFWSAAHSGFIGQNVYLYCAAEGIGARFYASVNAAVLKDGLQLRPDQAAIFGQAVGYPNE
jgi:nitroreductase